MTVTISDTAMTSDRSHGTARHSPDRNGWEVSWLPGQLLDRNTAITAMTLADTAAEHDLPASTPAPPGTSRPQPDPATERLAYSVNEAARLTGLSRDLLYDQMRQGNLDYIKVGRRRLITRHHLQRFLGITPGAERPAGINASAHSTGSDEP